MERIAFIDPARHIHLESVDSTNSYIRNVDILPGSWVTADEQTHGRGRCANSWTALGTDRLIFSAKLNLARDNITAFSLLAGGAVFKACRDVALGFADELRLKWPND